MPARLWFALFAPPTAWFVSLAAGYFLVAPACRSALGALALHAALLAGLSLSVSGGVAAFASWRRLGGGWPDETARPRARDRFVAVVAGFGGLLFSLVILWFWIAALTLEPCEPDSVPGPGPDAVASAPARAGSAAPA